MTPHQYASIVYFQKDIEATFQRSLSGNINSKSSSIASSSRVRAREVPSRGLWNSNRKRIRGFCRMLLSKSAMSAVHIFDFISIPWEYELSLPLGKTKPEKQILFNAHISDQVQNTHVMEAKGTITWDRSTRVLWSTMFDWLCYCKKRRSLRSVVDDTPWPRRAQSTDCENKHDETISCATVSEVEEGNLKDFEPG